MSYYENMLLEKGGGIFPEYGDRKPSDPEKEKREAGLVIGLGGTGTAALNAVREDMLREREMPGIRFLAVDEDASSDIALLSRGAQGPSTRQRGRSMIIAKAPLIRARVEELCRSALSDKETDSLSVFVLAGLSGITGGGCLADLCYIVRDVLRGMDENISTQIHGIFFLPDVAQSSPAVFGHRDVVERRFEDACGYAALKELDSMMRLSESGRRFCIRYSDNFSVDTDERPVDFFYLVSASNEYGSLSSNAYETCLETAAGYVSEYFRMPGNIRGEYNRKRREGQSSNYITMLGVSQRLLPLAQMTTLAASRFCLEFQKRLKEKREAGPTYAQSHDAALAMGLETETILKEAEEGYPNFSIPDTDMRRLRACGAVTDGEFPSVWTEDIEGWMETCAALRKENCKRLRKKFRDAISEKIAADMYAPGRGPYYVKDFLERRGSDIREVVHEIREDVRDRFRVQKESLYGRNGRGGLVTELERASTDFVRSGLFGRGKKYERYRAAAEKLACAENEILLLSDVSKLLKKTDAFIEKYERDHIDPLLEVLENLGETASENFTFLESRKREKPGFAKPFFRTEDLEPSLRAVWEDTDREELSGGFLDFLQRTCAHGSAAASRRIRGWLSSAFGSLCLEAADEYVIQMQEQMERALERLCRRTTGQLWCDYDREDGERQFLFLDVPGVPASLYRLAETAVSSGILYSCAENAITAVRVTDGISLSGCRSLSGLEKEYFPYRETEEINLNLTANPA